MCLFIPWTQIWGILNREWPVAFCVRVTLLQNITSGILYFAQNKTNTLEHHQHTMHKHTTKEKDGGTQVGSRCQRPFLRCEMVCKGRGDGKKLGVKKVDQVRWKTRRDCESYWFEWYRRWQNNWRRMKVSGKSKTTTGQRAGVIALTN